MAFDFSKLNFLGKLNARARVLVVAAIVFGIIVFGYLLSLYFSGGSQSVGPSRVASAPSGLQSVQGGNLTPEYQRALLQANTQIAQKAQITGGSAVPTVVNFNPQSAPGTGQCNIICTDQSAKIKPDIDDMVSQGKISPELGKRLQQMADDLVSTQDFAAFLDQLVKEGKLTPEQARLLYDKYKKQYQNALLEQSAASMDEQIKAGNLPLEVATGLLAAQKMGATPADYAATLQDLSQQEKISPATAQQLLSQFTSQRAKEIIAQSVASIRRMIHNGEITAPVGDELIELEYKLVPVDTYEAALNRNLSAGKMTPIAAKKILDEFKMQKASMGPAGSINKLLQDAEAAAFAELSDLLKAGKISQETASTIAAAIQQNISLDAFQAMIDNLVKQNKLTPEIAKLKMADYQRVKGLRELAERLGALQGNNAAASAYSAELKNGVQGGVLTPQEATQLMQEYQALLNRDLSVSATAPAAPGSEALQALQQKLSSSTAVQNTPSESQFVAVKTEAAQTSTEDQQARIQNILTAMSGQAQQLVAAWQPVPMTHKEASSATTAAATATAEKAANGTEAKNPGTALTTQAQGNVLIKAGSVLFAVLDTAVNSDYPDSPVMATVVDGKYKGSKLLGKVTTTKGVSGQMDRVMLSFTLMNRDEWSASKPVTAYAIDPDTARTVLASSVDYHYMKRFGAMMATSFLQGYGQAVQSSGGSSIVNSNGTSTQNAVLSPSNKIAVALGQMGTTLGQVTQNYANLPPTVKVDSGVGLGILFMSDVT